MRRRIATILAAGAGLAAVATVIVIGVGVVDTRAALYDSTPAPATTIDPASSVDAASSVDDALAPVVSDLPLEMVEGLPGYGEAHDRGIYIQVQTSIDICMTEHGYSYQFELAPESGDVLGFVSTGFHPMPAEFDQGEQLSLYGEPSNLLPAYDWEKGGCYGEAVYKAGLLDGQHRFTAEELAEIGELYDSMAHSPEQPWGYAGETPGFGQGFDASVADAIDSSITACMAGQGIEYEMEDNVRPDGSVSLNEGAFSMRPASGAAAKSFFDDALVVLYGARTPSDAPYDWRTGGCYGAAIHDAGIAGTE